MTERVVGTCYLLVNLIAGRKIGLQRLHRPSGYSVGAGEFFHPTCLLLRFSPLFLESFATPYSLW